MSGYLKIGIREFHFTNKKIQSTIHKLKIISDDNSCFFDLIKVNNQKGYIKINSPFSHIKFALCDSVGISSLASPIDFSVVPLHHSKKKKAKITFHKNKTCFGKNSTNTCQNKNENKSKNKNESQNENKNENQNDEKSICAEGVLSFQIFYTHTGLQLINNYKLLKTSNKNPETLQNIKKILEQLIGQNPKSHSTKIISRALLSLIEIYRSKKNESLKHLETILRYDPSWYQGLKIQGIIYYLMGDYQLATNGFKEYLKNEPIEPRDQIEHFLELSQRKQKKNLPNIDQKSKNENENENENDNENKNENEKGKQKEKDIHNNQNNDNNNNGNDEKELLEYISNVDNIDFDIKNISEKNKKNSKTNTENQQKKIETAFKILQGEEQLKNTTIKHHLKMETRFNLEDHYDYSDDSSKFDQYYLQIISQSQSKKSILRPEGSFDKKDKVNQQKVKFCPHVATSKGTQFTVDLNKPQIEEFQSIKNEKDQTKNSSFENENNSSCTIL
ncbi:hypothetical protein M0813_10263 [Anaeramoeba flamelloides]|uniref:Tetratricopeptide repeat protein n=1 Tax=Anaeramoeba flamelloides TaxID=1746091 RepID=A0ABQ8X3K6_9EUKA|nr:hypothetical protein M0813_10263 [Anaeramoeba flamelloides]